MAKCRLCKSVIVSKYRHDFVKCKCGEIFVDGGLEYLRRGGIHLKNFIDLSIVGSDKNEKKILGIKKRKAAKDVGS